jgi:hypothetical protein
LYTVDDLDQLVELLSVPKQEPNVPDPAVFAKESLLVLSYWERDDPPLHPTTQPMAAVVFEYPYFHLFGPPNDEAISGHPLYNRNLLPGRAYTVKRSSLVRHLEKMNSVHRNHDPRRYDALTHYLFTFRDSVFECVAKAHKATTEGVGIEKESRTFEIFNKARARG